MELNEQIQEIKSMIEVDLQEAKANKEVIDSLKSDLAKLQSEGLKQEDVDALLVKMKQEIKQEMQAKAPKATPEQVTYFDALVKGIKERFTDIKSTLTNEKSSYSFELKEFGYNETEQKAVGDMSWQGNTPGFSFSRESITNPMLLQGIRFDLMRNILPTGSTSSATISYPYMSGSEGNVDNWGDVNPAVVKPQLDFDFLENTVKMEWLAGFVRVPISMLDDIEWLNAFLRLRLLRSLYKKENQQILMGTGTNNQFAGINSVAVTSVVTETDIAKRVMIDAANMKINSDGDLVAGVIIMNPLDVVSIAFSQNVLVNANGLIKYDTNSGLVINGIRVVENSSVPAGTYYIGDQTASMFVRRMAERVEISYEDRDNFVKNLVTIRIEERANLVHFQSGAWIKSTIPSAV